MSGKFSIPDDEPIDVASIAWQEKLRQAIFESVTEEDVKGIVRAQVDKAKAGDKAALKFVMEYIVGAKNQPTKLVQQNYYQDVATAARMARTGTPRVGMS